MSSDYTEKDYEWIKELMGYPQYIREQLSFFDTTSDIELPEDPIEKVVFQDRAKAAIRKVAQNKGHILMVGRPGTGKSMLANMFNIVLDKSFGDYLRPRHSIIAYPGKDKNHIRIAYEEPDRMDDRLGKLNESIENASNFMEEFSLSDQIGSLRKAKKWMIGAAALFAVVGFFFPMALVLVGLLGIGAIFMFIQEHNMKAQEKIQRDAQGKKKNAVKQLYDNIPEVLYDPRRDRDLMAVISEPDSRNMKGGFRHDPYQSGNLHTPPHQRAFLGAHAKSPIIFIDELKALIRVGYMPHLLEIMQNKEYILEGGTQTGSGSADRSENKLKAENIFIACCNHDTLTYLKQEGDGAFLSRIEDKGEIIMMESAVPETPATIKQVAQYIKQEINNLNAEFKDAWGEIIEKEGYDGVRKRCEHIYGRTLPELFTMQEREFSKDAVLEVIKELRCRSSDRKLSSILRPLNGIIRTAEFEAIFDNGSMVEPRHVRQALEDHLSLEGVLTKELLENRKDLKKYISSLTDSIGYVVGLAVVEATAGGQMYGQPLPIHCQVNVGGSRYGDCFW